MNNLVSRANDLLAEIEQRRKTNKYKRYSPYDKQLEFHNATERERLLMAANQVGKTYGAGMEACFHATGQYPDWWDGRVITRPNIGWVCGVSLEGLRDGAQNLVLGTIGQEGTGTIPKDRIIKIGWKQNQAVDYVRVRWGPLDSGQESFLSFKSYDQGRAKFQAASVTFITISTPPSPTQLFVLTYLIDSTTLFGDPERT